MKEMKKEVTKTKCKEIKSMKSECKEPMGTRSGKKATECKVWKGFCGIKEHNQELD